jgi:hypothetical protein
MTLANLVWSIVVAAVAVVVSSAIALLLIPPLSLNATIRGGTIAFLSIVGVRLTLWYTTRRQSRG